MFWSKGDTAKLTPAEKRTLDHLRRLEETGHIMALPPEQAQIAIRGVVFFGQWESVFKLLNSIKNTAMLVGAILAIYWVTKDQVATWIGNVASRAETETGGEP